MAITDTQREEFHRRYEEELQQVRANRPAGWEQMSSAERDMVNGFHPMSEDEVQETFGADTTVVTFFGPFKPELVRGSIVMVQTPRGWENNMVAADFAAGVVYVAEASEWQRAKAENRAPLTVAYPAERVRLANSELDMSYAA